VVMANSKYEYVKDFEVVDNLMPHTWIVIRIDGRGFTKYALPSPLIRI
jgi:tRNA(His) guanylyltransferase